MELKGVHVKNFSVGKRLRGGWRFLEGMFKNLKLWGVGVLVRLNWVVVW
jgi:hypothetical protein